MMGNDDTPWWTGSPRVNVNHKRKRQLSAELWAQITKSKIQYLFKTNVNMILRQNPHQPPQCSNKSWAEKNKNLWVTYNIYTNFCNQSKISAIREYSVHSNSILHSNSFYHSSLIALWQKSRNLPDTRWDDQPYM